MTITVRPDQYRTLRRGDRIVATDLGSIPGGVTVLLAGANTVALQRPGALPAARLYADQHGTLTVERKPPRKVTRRHYDGLTLVADGPNRWVTLDGQHDVLFDSPGMYVCDDEQPVREARGRGYLCGGGVEHAYAEQWCPGSADGGVDTAVHEWHPTLGDAARSLASVLRRRGLLDAANTPTEVTP